MAKPLTDYLAQWVKRDPEYRKRHGTDEAFAREEMSRYGLSPEHQELLFRGNVDEIRNHVQRELHEHHDLPYDFDGGPWGYGKR